MRYHSVSIAIPALAESANLPHLIQSLKQQSFSDFDVYICVNNPDSWSMSDDEYERGMYLDNQRSLQWLYEQQKDCRALHVLDISTPTKGWTGKRRGVGWARKVLLDAIMAERGEDELVVSLDADTDIGEKYLETIIDTFNANPHSNCLAVPYYHPLTGIDMVDRAMLRYEIYMRHYLVNLFAIKQQQSDFPYAFTALGSAMVFPLWAYRRVGGFTPLQGGEDFYLMQKFAKTGKVLLSCNEIVRPQGRASSRVPFGTGPAIAKGVDSMEDTYPLYPHEAFEAVAETYRMFPVLYERDYDTPMSGFLSCQLKTDELWQPLRRNFKTRELFVHACQERVDGLRILQFLKQYRSQMFDKPTAEEELCYCCKLHGINIRDGFSFGNSPVSDLDLLRNNLFCLEKALRKRFDALV